MRIKNVYYSSDFKKSLNKLPGSDKRQAKKKIQLFLKDPFAPPLKTHKLLGKLKNYWSFSVNYRVRILFEFIDEESVGFIDIGTHQIYR